VVDDLGRLGRVWRKTDYEATDLETVVTDILAGEYKSPVGVFAFNSAEGWSRDVSADIADELRRRCAVQLDEPPAHLLEFLDRYDHLDHERQLALPLRVVIS
jgi:hypothetical protein